MVEIKSKTRDFNGRVGISNCYGSNLRQMFRKCNIHTTCFPKGRSLINSATYFLNEHEVISGSITIKTNIHKRSGKVFW